jgi:hypothetical protein
MIRGWWAGIRYWSETAATSALPSFLYCPRQAYPMLFDGYGVDYAMFETGWRESGGNGER